MEKGWNYEYFDLKRKQLEEKSEEVTDLRKRESIEEDIEMCDYLRTILLFSEGETFYTKVTMKNFVDEMYNQDFLYRIPSSEVERIEQIALSFSKLPKLKMEQDYMHITPNDSIEIVGDFIKDTFSDKHYRLFKDVFVNHYNYILFDKESESSDVSYFDGEIFVRIAKSENMKMLSSIAHESGHIYRMVNNDHKALINPYGEYESFFYEFNFLLWLIKNNLYPKEAANYFLHLFDTMEKVSYMRYLIRKYKLNKIEDSAKFSETISRLHIRKPYI